MAVFLLAACSFEEGPGGAPADGAAEEFRIAVGVEPDTLDPAGQTTTTIANIVDYPVETLVKIDKDGRLRPGLAKSWEVSEDGRTVTLQLRDSVTFHDGSALDAQRWRSASRGCSIPR